MTPLFLADTILIVHVIYVGIVVFSVPLIIVGRFCKWQWVRNFWFRIIHLSMIVIVAAEALLGINCPLTVWERSFRPSEVQGKAQVDFIAGWLDKILFWNFPYWVFTAIYVLFGILVGSLFVLVPTKHRHHRANLK